MLINEAMHADIEFNFSKIGQEEMRLIAGGVELKKKMATYHYFFYSEL